MASFRIINYCAEPTGKQLFAVGRGTGSLYAKCDSGWIIIIGRGKFEGCEGRIEKRLDLTEVLLPGTKIEITT